MILAGENGELTAMAINDFSSKKKEKVCNHSVLI